MQFLRELKHLNEAYIDRGIEDELKRQGYHFLGAGVDQQAWRAKNGTVIKIFGTNGTGKASGGHKMFYAWEKFCKKWSHSHLVPHHIEFSQFKFKGEAYLQIRMEHLFSLTDWMATHIEEVVNRAADMPLEAFKRYISDEIGTSENHFLAASRSRRLSEIIGSIDDIDEFWQIVNELAKIAMSHDWQFDLHDGNLMLDDHGKLVIVDPWHTGD